MRGRFALLGSLLVLLATAAPVSAAPVSVYAVTGLDRPVTLVQDEWGIPHIYAQGTGDLFLAQGFNAARERLFQLDLWRRRGLGLLSEAFGPSYVEQDAAARLFLYRGDMDAEWASYGPEAKLAATRFANGVNAYLDWLARNPRAMPEEFRLLGHSPSRWRPEDVVRIRSHGLIGNLRNEVTRSRVTCAAGVKADQLRWPTQPADQARVPDGFDPCSLPADVLRTYDLATQAVTFTGTTLQAQAAPDFTEGSNNWVISGDRTASGRPILANDPHRGYAAPSLRYISHLSAPGLDVIGAGEPAQPGISLGHNGSVAFGLTVFNIDQEDLYVYQLDPADHTRYRYGSGWERMTTLDEKIPVNGADAKAARLSFTRHGPVIKVDEQRHVAYAVRSAWFQPGTSPYYGSLKLMRAKNFSDFKDAMRTWGGPAENQVYADTSGDIGWVPGGLTPIRKGYDGLFPVPGDGRYEWTGYQTDFPSSLNPAKGFIATANEDNVPPEYRDRGYGYEFADPVRFQRITDVLGANPRSTVADSAKLQGDQLSLTAQRIVALVKHPVFDGWDGVEGVDSAPAALFEVWRKLYLGPGLVKAVLPSAANLIARPDNAALVDALEHPEPWFGADAIAKRDRLLADTLDAAYADVARRLGPDPAAWKWGDLQSTVFEHPLAPVAGPRLNVGPFRRGGSETVVNASGFRATDFRQTGGPSFRMVLDVGNWDASLATNAPGQSGDPASTHYRDLADSWASTAHVPLLYSRAQVERHADKRILLLPA
ncbi:penicillin amidase [Amycolatopsis xylanica]|uniref:Penicillin amidase n=1 Tax=Amycolatopsis xylanica TaxID=589385 RepID=A0A1H3R017_9PSEU|nr:penicillin acylase family protein [Amycolatopsis xylanica]SDZ19017.1 penicillin amidase [Amycolatopsis xylanica]